MAKLQLFRGSHYSVLVFATRVARSGCRNVACETATQSSGGLPNVRLRPDGQRERVVFGVRDANSDEAME